MKRLSHLCWPTNLKKKGSYEGFDKHCPYCFHSSVQLEGLISPTQLCGSSGGQLDNFCCSCQDRFLFKQSCVVYWQVRGFVEAVMHPQWDGHIESGYNIALVQLNESLINATVPLLANETATVDAGQEFSAIGWGPTDEGFFSMRPRKLQETELVFLVNDNCQAGYDDLYQQHGSGCGKVMISQQMLCAWGGSGVDACRGAHRQCPCCDSPCYGNSRLARKEGSKCSDSKISFSCTRGHNMAPVG